MGKRDIQANGRLDMLPFDRAASFAAVDMRAIYRWEPEHTTQMFRAVIELWNKKVFRPVQPVTVFPYSKMEEAFRFLQEGKHTGKVVLTPSDDDAVKVVPQSPVPGRMRQDVTYLLAGGTGSLGRSIARWMASRGARFLVFLSRSGDSKRTTQELLAELQANGVVAHALRCDVSDEAAVIASLEEARRLGMPEIAGVLQASMELNDSSIEFMSHTAYQRTLAPKVRGSWNLHRHVPENIEFFIMLSSACGIAGNRGQVRIPFPGSYLEWYFFLSLQE
jgi:hypothetical protein